MNCEQCGSEIPKGETYFKHQESERCFCSIDCLTDWMIYDHLLTIETCGEDDDE